MRAKATNGVVDVTLDGEHLAPCPFCGGEAELTHTWTAYYWVACKSCGAECRGPVLGKNDRWHREHLAAAQSALTAWNTRA